jgi:hypothetical protein
MDVGTILPGIQHAWVILCPRHVFASQTQRRAESIRDVVDAQDRQQCSSVGIGIAWPSDIGRSGTNPESWPLHGVKQGYHYLAYLPTTVAVWRTYSDLYVAGVHMLKLGR